MTTTPAPGVFYYLTDPETAATIAHRGFEHSGIWSPHSTATLLDRVPSGMGGGIIRINLTPERALEALRLERSHEGEDFRRFLVPMELLRNAYITRLTEPAG